VLLKKEADSTHLLSTLDIFCRKSMPIFSSQYSDIPYTSYNYESDLLQYLESFNPRF